MKDFEEELRRHKFETEEAERKKQAHLDAEAKARLSLEHQSAQERMQTIMRKNKEIASPFIKTVSGLLGDLGRAALGDKVGNTFEAISFESEAIARWTTGFVETAKNVGDKKRVSTDLSSFGDLKSFWSTKMIYFQVYLVKGADSAMHFSVPEGLNRSWHQSRVHFTGLKAPKVFSTEDTSVDQLKTLLKYEIMRGPFSHTEVRFASSPGEGAPSEKN